MTSFDETPAPAGRDEEGQATSDTQARRADLIATIREHNRRRNDLHRAEKSLTLQIKAIARRFCDGDKGEAAKLYAAVMAGRPHPHAIDYAAWIMPLAAPRDAIAAARKAAERTVEKAARGMPVWTWCASVRGLGPLSLGQLVGEAGDLGSYANPGKLWKRMGLAVFDGRAQRRVAGKTKAAKAEAIRQGYSPTRRSLVFVVGDNLIRAKNAEYTAIYAARKEYELARAPAMTKLHAHRRAKRYMEKRLLRELWRAWRAAKAELAPMGGLPPAEASPDAPSGADRRASRRRSTSIDLLTRADLPEAGA